MIVQTTITIDGNEFLYTYSDDDRYVVNGDGVAYESAIDPLDSGRTYTEGDKIEAQINLGWHVNSWGIGDLADMMTEIPGADVDAACEFKRARFASPRSPR